MFPIYVADGQYGLLEETRYPKAGSENPQVKVGVVSVGEEEGVIWADFDPAADQYFGQPFWSPDGSVLLVQWMNRDQNVLKLYTVDPADGSKKIIYTEEQPAWLEWISDPIFWEKGILMVRDFESWEQVYFCSLDGNLLRRLTDGRNWGISLHGTNPKGDFLFFSARREISTRTDLYRLPLAGAKGKKDLSVQRLTTGHTTIPMSSFLPITGILPYFVPMYQHLPFPSLQCGRGLVRQLGDSRGDAYDLELEKGMFGIELHFLTTEDGFTIPAIIARRSIW